MANQQLRVEMTLKDKLTGKLSGMQKHWIAFTASIIGAGFAVKKLATTMGLAGKEVLEINAKFEKWTTQLEAFTGSAILAKEKLEELIDFSVSTPFTPEEVLGVSALLLPLEQAGHKLKDLLTMAGNIAATYPMTFKEAALNLNKALSAGMGSARLFYEQGVRSHMQVISGVKDLTKVSQQELAKIFQDIYLNPSSPLSQGIKKLSLDYTGLVSTMQGEWMIFKKSVGEKLFENVKIDLIAVLGVIRDSKEEGGEYGKVVEEIGDYFDKAYESAKDFVVTTVVGVGQMIDAFNELTLYVAKYNNFIQTAAIGAQEFLMGLTKYKEIFQAIALATGNIAGAKAFESADIETMEAALAEMEQKLVEGLENELRLQEAANVDYATILQEKINMLKSMLDQKKTMIEKSEQATTAVVKKETQERTKSDFERWQAETKLWLEGNKSYVEASISMGKTTATIMGELATMTGETWLKSAEIVINTIISTMQVIISAINSTLGPLGWLKAALEITAITLAAANAFAQIEAQKKALSSLKSQTATPTVSVPALASGGDIMRPGWAMVGERGPELRYLPQGAQVRPLSPVSRDLSQGGINLDIYMENVTMTSKENVRELAEQISGILSDEIARA